MSKTEQSPPPARIGRDVLIAYALAALAALFWAGNWVVGRAMRSDIPPLELNFWRWTIATAVILPFAWNQAKRDWPLARKHWRLMLGLGASGAALFHSMVYVGLRSTQAINALLLNATAPIIIILIAWLMYRDRISARQFLGICLSLLGAVVLVSRGDGATLLNLRFNAGDQWVVSALFVWGTYANLLKHRPAGLGGLSLLLYVCVIGVVLMLPAYLWELSQGPGMTFNPTTIISVSYTALFASVFAFLCFNWATARVGAITTSFFLHLMPVFGGVLAIIFLGEALHLYHLLGFAVVLAGIFISTTKRRRA